MAGEILNLELGVLAISKALRLNAALVFILLSL